MLLLLPIYVLVMAYYAALAYLRTQWLAIPQHKLQASQIPGGISTAPFHTQALLKEYQPTLMERKASAPDQKQHISLKQSKEYLAQDCSCSISVIVVVRNEAQNLPLLFRALGEQTLSPQLFELHLVDDASTDASWRIAETFQKRSPFAIHLHRLKPPAAGGSPKKAAISQVMQLVKGHLIAVTDGDCQPEPGWLANIWTLWQQEEAVFISGPVRYMQESNLFEKMQALDFAALIGVGAALLQAGSPGMCNAANMAFSRQAFLQVGGYRGNEHVPSGDDEFLLQKLAAAYPRQLYFLKSTDALVSTRACSSWQQFLHQRKRWAGKWRMHKGVGTTLLAVLVFVFYLMMAGIMLTPFLISSLTPWVAGAFIIKAVADYRFLSPVLCFLKKPLSRKVFLLMELVYPFYVLFFAVAANVGSFVWKERAYRYTTSEHERTGISSVG